jgi:UMF1 family MFS transporter
MQQTVLNDPKVINGWALFDWANSAYFLVIATAIFPPYYNSVLSGSISIFGNEIQSTAMFSYAVSASYIVLAFLSPLLSGIADYSGRRKYFMRVFTTLGSLACICLFFFSGPETAWLGNTAFMISTVGAAGALVFYDSFLPQIATEDKMDSVSARGYAFGYIGSVLLLGVCLVLIMFPEIFGITSATLQSRFGFVLVGIWWLGFAQITFRRLPADVRIAGSDYLRRGFRELVKVWEKLKTRPDILRFLAAYFFYNAGVLTVIYVATLFAQVELNFETPQLIMTVLLLQIVAIGGAFLFARISQAIGNKIALMIMVFIWIIICLGAYLVTNSTEFYILAGLVGLVLGGIQSLSRSTYSKLLDHMTDDLASYFSFYDVLTKCSLVVGTFLFGFAIQLTGNMRSSVLVLSALFVISLIILATLKTKKLKNISTNNTK